MYPTRRTSEPRPLSITLQLGTSEPSPAADLERDLAEAERQLGVLDVVTKCMRIGERVLSFVAHLAGDGNTTPEQ